MREKLFDPGVRLLSVGRGWFWAGHISDADEFPNPKSQIPKKSQTDKFQTARAKSSMAGARTFQSAATSNVRQALAVECVAVVRALQRTGKSALRCQLHETDAT